jgi:hypothetical protein
MRVPMRTCSVASIDGRWQIGLIARSKREKKRQQESRYLRVARLAYHITQQALPRYSHPPEPTYLRSHQLKEPAVKALVYDLHRQLVHALSRSLQLSEIYKLR